MSNMQFGLYNDSENIPEQRPSSAFQSTTLGLRGRVNQDLRPSNNVNTSVTSRLFGLRSRILYGNRKAIQDADEVKRNMSVISRTSGMISEDLGLGVHNNERFHELRRNDFSVNRSFMSRPFGLQTRNLTSLSHMVAEDTLRPNDHSELMNYRRSNSNISSLSRMLDLRPENLGGLNSHDNETLNHDIRKNNYVNPGSTMRTETFSSRNLTVNSGLPSDGGLRLNEDSMFRSNGVSSSKSFRPIASSSTLSAGLQMQDSERYNDVDDGGFKRPLISKVIKGRNSTLSTRLFHSDNIDRHCKDLSNINGFNVSHVSQRNVDTFSGSRLAISMRNNCADNQSICHSVSSVASVKSQVLNLLENVHYSLLKIGPHFRAEAVRLVFEKAKQNVENLSEMSVANSIWNGDAASVISQSSKNMAPTVCQTTMSNTLDGGLLHLKSSKEILESLIMSKEDRNRKKTRNNSSIQKGGKSVLVRSSRREEADESASAIKKDDNLTLAFKSPKSSPKKKKGPRVKAGGATGRVKSHTSKAEGKVLNLKQWYPIAVGSNLAFCGVDEEGATVKTDAVKKRLNNRKVVLMNGLACHLIGSPSTMVSVLPERIMSLLKNGLTERWRVFQKELLNCQTVENSSPKRKTMSPKKVTSSSKKKTVKTPKPKVTKERVQNQKITSTPEDGDGSGMQTRSGRTIKPPKMFWLVPSTSTSTESDEVTSSSTWENGESSSTKSRKVIQETPVKRIKKVASDTPRRKVKASRVASLEKRKKPAEKTSPEKTKTKPSEVKGNKKKEREEEVVVDSLTEYTERQSKSRQTSNKRKREVTGEADSVLPKKSKLWKKSEVEVSETPTKRKKEKSGPYTSKQSPKLKIQKLSPTKKKKAPVKKKTSINASESKKETKETKGTKGTRETKETREVSMCENDFELNLDDIEIPEIGNISGSTRLNRSQLRLESMETPPLKYFTNNLKILGSATPVDSPDWWVTQRTESEVKQFQKRREKAFKKKMKVDVMKTMITEKSSKNFQNRDVKRVMEWVAEKTVKSPQWNSKVLQYIIPSRKRMEQQSDEDEDEDIETEFL